MDDAPEGAAGWDDPVLPLTIVRVPGPLGPALHCRGDLTVQTQESLRRAILLLSLHDDQPVFLNLSGIRRLDDFGVAAILWAGEHLSIQDPAGETRSRLVIGTGAAPCAPLLCQALAAARLRVMADGPEGRAADGPTNTDPNC